MCLICDGWTPEEVLELQLQDIDSRGFTLMSVTGPMPWTYTIGLRWHLEMPELIVVGWPGEQAATVIHEAVDVARRRAADIRCGSSVTVGAGTIGFGRVAPENAAGEWFAQWHHVARASGHGHRSLRALQVHPICGIDCVEPHDVIDRALARRTTPDAIARRRCELLHGTASDPDSGGSVR